MHNSIPILHSNYFHSPFHSSYLSYLSILHYEDTPLSFPIKIFIIPLQVISQVTPHPPLPSHTQNYGIVPHLKSSRERTEEDSNMTSPNLITSLGTKFTNQIHLMETDKVSTSLIISISRDLTPFKVSQPTNSYASLNTGPLPLSSKRPHPHPYGLH